MEQGPEKRARTGHHCLFSYQAFLVHRGAVEFSESPAWEGQQNRALLQASLGQQRAPGDSRKGLDHLLPPGLSKEEHVRQALQTSSPFAPDFKVDMDLEFSFSALGIWGPILPRWQDKVRKCLHRLIHSFDAVASYLHDSAEVAQLTSRKPVALAVLTALLRWPDVTQPLRYLTGFQVIGDIEHSGVFRDVEVPKCLSQDSFAGEAAVSFVDDILQRKPPKDVEAIWRLTLEEREKSWCSGPHTRHDMDRLFGSGQWRPVPRFLVTQPCGKQRLIDNAKKGLHNEATSVSETIYTIGIDMWPVIARGMARAVLQQQGSAWPDQAHVALASLPPWFLLVASVMDLPDAYRGCPVDPHQRKFAVVAVFAPQAKAWRFFAYTGLLYGLASAVVSFNRLPTLLVAAGRRLLALACGAYFDDLFDMNIRSNATASMQALLHVLQLAGAPPAPAKTQPPGPARVYLGAAINLAAVESDGVLSCGPTFSTVFKIQEAIRMATKTMEMTPAQAAKLRGQAGWAGSLMHGKCGRLAINFLKRRQYSKHNSHAITPADLKELQLLARLAQEAQPQSIQVLGRPRKPIVVYSDASYENGKATCGWVVFSENCQPVGQTVVLSDEWLATLEERETQIFVAEAFCVLLFPFNLPQLFQHQDVLWFMDNEAAAAAAIRGSSGSSDVDRIIRVACLQFLALHGMHGSTLRAIHLTDCLIVS